MLQGFRRWKYIYFRPDQEPEAASKNQLSTLWQESNLQPCDFGVAQGPVYEGWMSAIHRIVIFSTFVKCLKNCGTTDIDDTRSIKNI
jgi:hypothetical protein